MSNRSMRLCKYTTQTQNSAMAGCGELYEAAELDGAGVLRRIWHVTIPRRHDRALARPVGTAQHHHLQRPPARRTPGRPHSLAVAPPRARRGAKRFRSKEGILQSLLDVLRQLVGNHTLRTD
ncbi:hypothetical protein ABH930_006682 [Kitasatospora sp. GAS204A]|nr:hypothetical protein [Kitasatospora sp. GAS204B]